MFRKYSQYVVALLLAFSTVFVPLGLRGTQTAQAGLPIFTLGLVTKAALGWTGGNVSDNELEFCLVPLPPLPFPIPIPFLYIEINQDRLRKGPIDNAKFHLIAKGMQQGETNTRLYYIFFVSHLYADWEMDPDALTIANYVRGADKVFRTVMQCENADELPKADGVVFKIGTACADGTADCYYNKDGLKAAQNIYNELTAQQKAQNGFDPSKFPSYDNFCSVTSGDTCNYVCDPTQTCHPPTDGNNGG